ncbi:hypothetical protein [Ponticaulis profundi]|uniref:Uncharacterized protein n=1 Tax=Ponticaulis profundi TaxID=2665222 RepID=A0ABW1S9I2_9PROT
MSALPDIKWITKAVALCDKHKARIELPDGTVIEPVSLDLKEITHADPSEAEGASIHDLAETIRGTAGN